MEGHLRLSLILAEPSLRERAATGWHGWHGWHGMVWHGWLWNSLGEMVVLRILMGNYGNIIYKSRPK